VSDQLVIKDLTVAYNRVPAVHHLNLALRCGSCVGLLGPNGAGKTTLIKAIAGLLPRETGSIAFQGHEVGRSGQTVAYVPQHESVDWDFPMTVRGLTEMGRFSSLGLWKKFGKSDHDLVAQALEMTDLTAFADRQIQALSGGQQQRAFLARAWAQQADIYLLDEPFAGLDRNAQEAFTRALHRLRAANKLVLASHHDLRNTAEVFDQVVLMNGELVASGSTAETFIPENIERTYGTQIFSGGRL
jgi:ABC-type Mn2+/Zn2+ transport system ATPase subunit